MEDLTGKRFGFWTVLGFSHVSKNYGYYWLCKCDCGTTRKVVAASLKDSKRVSCGCFRANQLSERMLTHGMSRTDTYASWEHMIARCYNKKNRYFANYGGRGITVCKEWARFENFLEDMGERPKNQTLDRIDVDKGYYKDNCRWASNTQQANNTTRNIYCEFNGLVMTLSEWSRYTNVPIPTMRNRMVRRKEPFAAVAKYLIATGRWDGVIPEIDTLKQQLVERRANEIKLWNAV